MKQNRGKIWYSILAVLKVLYAPAHFWERGARCFVGRFSFWSGWWRSGVLFDRKRSAEYYFRERGTVQANRTYCDRSLFSPQLGWFEYAMPVYGSWRGEHMPGSIMERGAGRQRTPRSGMRSGAERIRCFLHTVDLEGNPPFAIYKCGMLNLKGWCSLLFCYTDSSGDMALSFLSFLLSCIRTCDSRKKFAPPNLGVELALAASAVLSRRVIP